MWHRDSALSASVLVTVLLLSFHGADAFSTFPDGRAAAIFDSCSKFETDWCKPYLSCTSTDDKDKCSEAELLAAQEECANEDTKPSGCRYCEQKVSAPSTSSIACDADETTIFSNYKYCSCSWTQTPDAQVGDASPPPPSSPPPADCISFAFEEKSFDYDDLITWEHTKAAYAAANPTFDDRLFPPFIAENLGDAWCQKMTGEDTCVGAATITGIPGAALSSPCAWTGSECLMSTGQKCPASCLPLLDRIEAPQIEIEALKDFQDLQDDDKWCSAVGLYVSDLTDPNEYSKAESTCNSVYVTFGDGVEKKRPCVWIPNEADPSKAYCTPWKGLGAACSGAFA